MSTLMCADGPINSGLSGVRPLRQNEQRAFEVSFPGCRSAVATHAPQMKTFGPAMSLPT